MNIVEMFRNWGDVAELSADSTIYGPGEPVDTLYVILEGEAQLAINGVPLAVEKAGGIIGEMALIKEGPRNLSVTALSDVRMAKLSRDQLKERIEKSSEFAIHMMSALATRLRTVDEYISRHEG